VESTGSSGMYALALKRASRLLGALLLRSSLLARFNAKAYMPDDPVLSTARGLYKLAALTAARRRS
jgi:hypothetical protein